MIYNRFSYLYPPRPVNAISPSAINKFTDSHDLQIKKNGTCNIIFVSPDDDITCMNRHKENHKAWTPDQKKLNGFTGLGDGWFVFVAELLHSKVKGIRDINYVHDILVADSNYLVGKTHDHRQKILHDLFETHKLSETKSHYVFDENLWIVKNHHSDFKHIFDELSSAEDEGIVLKEKSKKLSLCLKETSNNDGMLKSRITRKNITF